MQLGLKHRFIGVNDRFDVQATPPPFFYQYQNRQTVALVGDVFERDQN